MRHCPARIVAEFGKEHVTVEVTYTHCGHENQMAHLRIPEATQEIVRSQLQVGIPEKKVARTLRTTLTPSKTFHRSNILTFQDVRNISRKCQLNFESHCSADDPVSIDIFVQEQKEKNRAIILAYKKQGIVDPNYEGVGENDFILAFMTPFQKMMYEQVQSQEMSIICIDGTHHTNGYDFLFVTVLTKDNSGEGMPLAHLFTNREDYIFLKQFLRSLQNECGKIICNAFMSDDAPQYFQAWCSVMVDRMDIVPTKLLCAWHVTRSFERNIISKIKTNKESLPFII